MNAAPYLRKEVMLCDGSVGRSYRERQLGTEQDYLVNEHVEMLRKVKLRMLRYEIYFSNSVPCLHHICSGLPRDREVHKRTLALHTIHLRHVLHT